MTNIPFKSPLVVGYKGEVGSFLLNGLLKVMPKALNIWCFDINESPIEQEHRIKIADYIFLCIPMQDTVNWLIQHKDLLDSKIIIEQCSLKAPIYENEQLKDLDIRSMHLLFRPSATPDPADRRCALIGENLIHEEDAIHEMTEAKFVYYKNCQEHDKAMALQQALIHRILLTLDTVLHKSDCNTYVSSKIWELIERIRAGDKALYSLIQENSKLPEALNLFKKMLDKFKIEEHF